MLLNKNTQRHQLGFSLIEIISVLIILGIVGAVVGPFIGNVLGNYIQSRDIVERERQASLVLERFVRDVRMSRENDLTMDNNCSSTQTLYKENSNKVTYKQSGSNLTYNGQVLAKHIANVCFKVQNATSQSQYKLVSISFDLVINNENDLSYRASAVPRK